MLYTQHSVLLSHNSQRSDAFMAPVPAVGTLLLAPALPLLTRLSTGHCPDPPQSLHWGHHCSHCTHMTDEPDRSEGASWHRGTWPLQNRVTPFSSLS